MGYIGLIAGPIGTWCILEASAALPAVVSSIGFLVTPAFGLILANLALGEKLTPDLLLGVGTDSGRRGVRHDSGKNATMILHSVEMGQGAPVVLLHGLFGSGRNFGAVQKALSAESRVIALDLRNHGASPHAPVVNYGAMATDIFETLAALDALPAVLIGHSMGGKVAMRAALDRPEAVTALVVADIAPVTYPPHLQPVVDALVNLELVPGLTRAQADAALSGAVPEDGVRGFLLQNLALGAHPAWRIGLAEIAAGMTEIAAWQSTGQTYPGPALFIAGERSNYIQPGHRAPIRAQFPTARFVTLKDAGHWLHADNPAGFLAVLVAFLAAIRQHS